MAQERITSLVDERVFKELKKLDEYIISLEKKVNDFDIKLGDAKTMGQATGALNQLNDATQKLTKSVKEQEKAQEALDKERVKDFKYQQQLERQAKRNEKTLLRIEAAKRREILQIEKATNEYAILSKAYQEAALKAKNYALTLGETNPITLKAIDNANKMGDTLKRLDATVGQHQRNVGNYNMVGAQFNQLLRELPNAGISARTFLMSITNNVSYFAEAVNDARRNGQGFKQILTTMGRSLFSVVGIVNIAVLAFTYFTLQAQKTKDVLDKAEESAKRYGEAMQSASKSSAKSAVEEADKLQILNNIATDTNASMDARIKATEEMQKLYPNYLKNLDREAIMAGKAADALNEITKALLVRAQMEAANKRLLATEERILDLKEQQKSANYALQKQIADSSKLATLPINAYKAQNVSLTNLGKTKDQALATDKAIQERSTSAAREKLNQINEELSAAEKLRERYLKMASDRAADAYSLLEFTTTTNKTQEENAQQLADLIDADIDKTWWAANEYKNSLYSIRQNELDALQLVEEKLSSGVISTEEAEKRKKEITDQYRLERLNGELAYYEAVAQMEADSDVSKELLTKIKELRLEIARLKNELPIEGDDVISPDVKERIDNIATAIRAVGQIASEFLGMQSDRMQARLNALQREGDQIRKNGEDAILYIQASSMSEEEKQKAIREQIAKTQAAEQANEARRRQAAEQKARFDKQAAISEIILNTGVAIMKIWSGEGNWVTKAIQTAALAGISAAQIARAQSAPLPRYEEGTLHHKGGAFIAGEKEKELVIRPDGKSYWTKDTPTMYNEPSGTKVLNSEMIHSIVGAGITPKMLSAIRGTSERDTSRRIENAIERTGKNTVRAITRNRAIQKVEITGTDAYYLRKVKGKA